jgi:hypothetical protein
MTQQPSDPTPDRELEHRIRSLIERTERQTPRTRQVLDHLPAIEEALSSGVTRTELAETFSCTPRQFAAALAGARRLHRRGGDGRLAANRRKPDEKSSRENRKTQSGIGKSNPLITKL